MVGEMVDEKPEPLICTRWGYGEDRCIKPFDHIGPCEDKDGNSTTSLAAALLGRKR